MLANTCLIFPAQTRGALVIAENLRDFLRKRRRIVGWHYLLAAAAAQGL